MRDRSSIFTQANDGVGAAMLQSKLKALADAQGVMIVSQRATDSRPFGGMTMRRARIELSGATRDVANVVRAIETSQAPALFIAGATVRVSTSAAPANGQAEPLLDAQIDVEAPFQTAGEPL
ncbi:MAG: hypothetical protein HZY79_08285 [Rhodoblastus sp.]|nr:MAG: hypothetical protein HZY79_08285 [Rhodoblastus sp.]